VDLYLGALIAIVGMQRDCWNRLEGISLWKTKFVIGYGGGKSSYGKPFL